MSARLNASRLDTFCAEAIAVNMKINMRNRNLAEPKKFERKTPVIFFMAF